MTSANRMCDVRSRYRRPTNRPRGRRFSVQSGPDDRAKGSAEYGGYRRRSTARLVPEHGRISSRVTFTLHETTTTQQRSSAAFERRQHNYRREEERHVEPPVGAAEGVSALGTEVDARRSSSPLLQFRWCPDFLVCPNLLRATHHRVGSSPAVVCCSASAQ